MFALLITLSYQSSCLVLLLLFVLFSLFIVREMTGGDLAADSTPYLANELSAKINFAITYFYTIIYFYIFFPRLSLAKRAVNFCRF